MARLDLMMRCSDVQYGGRRASERASSAMMMCPLFLAGEDGRTGREVEDRTLLRRKVISKGLCKIITTYYLSVTHPF